MLHPCHWQCFWPGESCVDFFFFIAFIHLFKVNVSHFLRAYVERDGGVAGQITPLQGLPCCCWCSGESRCTQGMKAASIVPLAWDRLVGNEVWIPPALEEPEQEFFFLPWVGNFVLLHRRAVNYDGDFWYRFWFSLRRHYCHAAWWPFGQIYLFIFLP